MNKSVIPVGFSYVPNTIQPIQFSSDKSVLSLYILENDIVRVKHEPIAGKYAPARVIDTTKFTNPKPIISVHSDSVVIDTGKLEITMSNNVLSWAVDKNTFASDLPFRGTLFISYFKLTNTTQMVDAITT